MRADFKHGGQEHLVWEADFKLDELLKQRAQGLEQMELDGFLISIAALLALVDDKFLS